MKILFVTLKALETNTSVTKSNIGILNGFEDMNCEIDIIMPSIDEELFYYDDSKLKLSKYNIYRIQSKTIGDKVAKKSNSNFKIIKKVISLLRKGYYKFKILDRGTQLLKESKKIDIYDKFYDYVISTSDPKSSHLFVKKMIKNGLNYGKWIQHWGDPLASDITYNGIYPMFIRKIVEKGIIDSADKIIYVSPFTLEEQRNSYKSLNKKMEFIPLPCEKREETLSKEKHDEKRVLKIAYLGDYNSSIRNIKPLYNVCKENSKYKLIIAGNTDITLSSTKNIEIFPRLKAKDIEEIEKKSDILVSICNLKGSQIPGKIYYESSTDKDILVALDGEYKERLHKYLSAYNRFECCENTEKSLGKKLEEIYERIVSFDKMKKHMIPSQLLPINVAKKIIE